MAMILCAPAASDTWIRRPVLSVAEQFEYGTSASDAIVLGVLSGSRDTLIVSESSSSRPQRNSCSYVLLSEIEVIKGSVATPVLEVLLPDNRPAKALQAFLAPSGGRGLFFLQQTTLGWMLAWSHAPGGGALHAGHDKSDITIDRVRALVGKQALDSVANEASVVVIGRPLEWHSRQSGQGLTRYFTVVVDSVISGAWNGGELSVICPMHPPISYRQAVFLLRGAHDGMYELVGGFAGLIPTEDHRGLPLISQLPTLVGRIRALRARATDGQE